MQGLRHPRRSASRERRSLRSSQVRGWRGTRWRGGTSDASGLRNLRRRSIEGSVAERAEEPPEWPGRGTSDASGLRNLRRRSVEGSVAERAEEPPEWPGRGTSGAARLRNLRQGSVEGSAAERRVRASD